MFSTHYIIHLQGGTSAQLLSFVGAITMMSLLTKVDNIRRTLYVKWNHDVFDTRLFDLSSVGKFVDMSHVTEITNIPSFATVINNDIPMCTLSPYSIYQWLHSDAFITSFSHPYSTTTSIDMQVVHRIRDEFPNVLHVYSYFQRLVKTCIRPSAIISSLLFSDKEVIGFHVHDSTIHGQTDRIQESTDILQERTLQKMKIRFQECVVADTIVAYACGDAEEMRLRIVNEVHTRCPKIRFINIPDVSQALLSEYPALRAVCDLFNLGNCVEIYQVNHFSSFSLLASMIGESALLLETSCRTTIQSLWTPSYTFDAWMYGKNNMTKITSLVRESHPSPPTQNTDNTHPEMSTHSQYTPIRIGDM